MGRRSSCAPAASSVLKLVALPLATWGFALALRLPSEQLAPLLVFQALPTASAAFVLARAMPAELTCRHTPR